MNLIDLHFKECSNLAKNQDFILDQVQYLKNKNKQVIKMLSTLKHCKLPMKIREDNNQIPLVRVNLLEKLIHLDTEIRLIYTKKVSEII